MNFLQSVELASVLYVVFLPIPFAIRASHLFDEPTPTATRYDTLETCHCGASYEGSDHCPICGCEQFESILVRDCGHTHTPLLGTVPTLVRVTDQRGKPIRSV
jgi:hypothetical protein